MRNTEAKNKQLRCPKHMSPEAKEEWGKVVKQIGETRGLDLTDLDTNALEIYCESMVTYRKAIAKVRETSEVYVSRADQNKPKKNPWLTVANESAAQVKKYGELLLLDPVSRAKAGIDVESQRAAEAWRRINEL